MTTRVFTSGRIRQADYDPGSRQLDLHFDNRSVLAYRHVPEEVFRRLCSAPNPATYWEDRIAEEYPKGTPKAPAAGTGSRPPGGVFGEGSD
ncbi:KTSC domain-containing protein [Ramlibacter sp.]|uniref:KTSC domain-containing protein n=1 Tax=Ramlibacter sp. TaxID=1917967 RepID=UPI002FCC5963